MRRNFTLLELMLTLTVLAIVLAVASPNLGRFYRGARLSSGARHVLARLNYCRDQATLRQRICRVEFSENRLRLTIQSDPQANPEDFITLDGPITEYALPPGLEWAGDMPKWIDYEPFLMRKGSVLGLRAGDDLLRVRVHAGSGRATIEAGEE